MRIFLLSLLFAFSLQAHAAKKTEIVFGFNPAENADTIETNGKKLSEYFQKKTGYTVKTFVATDYTALVEALRSGKIDFAFSHTTLHHLKDLGSFFREMKKALRPGGGFCIRDLRRPKNAAEAMEWIHEATRDNLTQRQYELFFYSLRAALMLAEMETLIKDSEIEGELTVPENPKRYWVFSRRPEIMY